MLAVLAVGLVLVAPAGAASRSLVVPVPPSGEVELAVVHLARAGATLSLSGTSTLPRTAAVVTGVSGRVGLVAVVNFHPRRSTASAQLRRVVRVASSVPFRLDYLGTVGNGCGKSGICPAVALDEVEQASRWKAGSGVLPLAAAEPSFRTKAGLLAQVVDALIGVPQARFLLALAGGPKPAAGGTGPGPATPVAPGAASGLVATASLNEQADGSVRLRVQNTGTVAITSVSLQGIDFSPLALAPPAGVSCRIAAPGMVCDGGFAIAPGQTMQFTIASYTCCLISGQVWVNTQTGTSGQYGPVVAAVT